MIVPSRCAPVAVADTNPWAVQELCNSLTDDFGKTFSDIFITWIARGTTGGAVPVTFGCTIAGGIVDGSFDVMHAVVMTNRVRNITTALNYPGKHLRASLIANVAGHDFVRQVRRM